MKNFKILSELSFGGSMGGDIYFFDKNIFDKFIKKKFKKKDLITKEKISKILSSNDYFIEKGLNSLDITIQLVENIPMYIDIEDTLLKSIETKISQNKKQKEPLTRILFVFDGSQSMLGKWQSGRKIFSGYSDPGGEKFFTVINLKQQLTADLY